MLKPEVLNPRPSIFMAILGAWVGMLLLTTLLFLGPALGVPLIDIPRLVGGIFSANEDVALWLGFAIFFLTGVMLFGPALAYFWIEIPGRNVGFTGATLKGLIWGLILFVLTGVLVWVAGLLNRSPGIENPGFFALNLGIPAAAWLLAGHLAFGLTTALITAMAQGIEPIDTLGWNTHKHGDLVEFILEKERRNVP
jgi:hypothetical protein